MILVDYSPVIISCAHSATSWKNGKGTADYDSVEDAHLFRMWHTIKNINVKFRRKYGSMVFCIDRKPYWRSEVFPNYKKNRKPMDRELNWAGFFENGENILKAAQNVFGWKVLDIPGMEADDIIGTLAEKCHRMEKVMIVSPDGDFKQLQVYPGVEQFDTIRNKKIIEKDPVTWLKDKIISGDKKDCVPNIISDIDTFVTDGCRQSSIQRRTKENWMATEPSLFCDASMWDRYHFNESILDLSKIPEEKKKLILDTYCNSETKKSAAYSYFAANGLSYFIDSLDDFK